MKISQKAAIPPSLAKLLEDIGANLARMRIARRMTQSIIAERAGVSRNTLSRIENGEPSIAVGQLVRYLAALDKAEVLLRALEAEDDAAVRQLALKEKSRRARSLSARELGRYDF